MKELPINFLGLDVNFESNSSLLARMIEKYRPLSSDNHLTIISPDRHRPIFIKMWSENNKFIVEDGWNRRFFFKEEKQAVSFCGSLFLGTCAERLQPGFSMFHAAAVCLGGEASIFLGDSGAGKTTMALSLVKEGFKLLCDDLSIVDLDTRFVLPLNIKIGIDKGSPFANLFTREKFDQSWNRSTIYADLENIFDRDHWGKPARLKSIFFLEQGNGKSHQIEPITQYQGFRRMCPFYIYGEKDLKMIVEQNCKIIKNAMCYVVRRGNIDETVNLVRETLLEEVKC